MVYQTTLGVDPRILKSGCYFRVIVRIIEVLLEMDFTVAQINKIFELCVKVGYIGDDGWMKEEAGKGVAQIASGLVQKHCYVKRVFSADKANFTASKYVLTGPHFCLEEGPHNEFFDPWSADGSNTRKNGRFDSVRSYFGEKI